MHAQSRPGAGSRDAVTMETQPRRYDPARDMLAPEIEFDPARIVAFERLFEAVVATPPGQPAEYACPFPKHEFLCYLAERKPVVLHGSNDPAIEEFVPRRQSLDHSPL